MYNKYQHLDFQFFHLHSFEVDFFHEPLTTFLFQYQKLNPPDQLKTAEKHYSDPSLKQ